MAPKSTIKTITHPHWTAIHISHMHKHISTKSRHISLKPTQNFQSTDTIHTNLQKYADVIPAYIIGRTIPDGLPQEIVDAISRWCIKNKMRLNTDNCKMMVLSNASDAFAQNVTLNDKSLDTVSYSHPRAHETTANLVCRLLLEKKKKNKNFYTKIRLTL